MKRLLVYLNRENVGFLEQDDSGLIHFRYHTEWLGRSDVTPLSRSLPLQEEEFRGKQTRPFFAGILPEEDPRTKIAAILGISARNDFAMLERIGGECAGAVSLLSEDAELQPAGEVRLHELSEAELQEVITELPRRPLMAGREGVRLSLAGAQDKLPVVVNDSGIHLPLGDTPSTHILKPEPDRFPGLVANEFFCMTLAGAVGLRVPQVESREIGEKPCLLIERFDRRIREDGSVERIHQEDFCQALGYPPERKYQEEGGPLLRDCISLLRDWSTAPVVDVRAFIDGLIFNALIGNGDAHAKNFSFLYRDGDRSLSPYYDLICTLAWPELPRNMAMKIGGCKSLDELNFGHWRKMAKETSLGWPGLRERIADLSRSVLDALDGGQARSIEHDAVMVDRLHEVIAGRAVGMLDELRP